jgi:hypothetical protein
MTNQAKERVCHDTLYLDPQEWRLITIALDREQARLYTGGGTMAEVGRIRELSQEIKRIMLKD